MIHAQLSSVEINFDDEVRALILLSSLPESWSGTVTAVSASAGKEKMKFDEVREIRRRESGSTSGSALSTDNRGTSNSRLKFNRSRSKSRGRSKSRKDIKCWNCGEYGHFRNQCRAPR